VQQGDPFRLIVTDVNMPEMSGFDFVGKLRGDHAFCETQVILLTSGGREGDNLLSDRLKIAERLMKPVKQSELFDAIVRALGVTAPEDCCDDEVPIINRPATGRLNILLAEDNVINQKLAVGVLEKEGHQVTVVGDGEAAALAASSGAYDVVLMDVQMPGMDGFEATQQIRDHERQSGRHLPIIAMTAHAMKGDRERCVASGMDDYVPKPIHIALLREKLARIQSALDRNPPPEQCLETGHAEAGHTDTSHAEAVHAEASHAEASGVETKPATPIERSASLSSPINWTRALGTVGGDEHLLRDLLAVYQGEAHSLMKEMGGAIQDADYRTLRRAAHTLKGASLSIGASDTAEAAEKIELLPDASDLTVARQLFDDLKQIVDRARQCASEYLAAEQASS
jgi:CheY-like chemotaxis protein